MATPTVNLATINPLIEIVVRAGDAKTPEARKNLQEETERCAKYSTTS